MRYRADIRRGRPKIDRKTSTVVACLLLIVVASASGDVSSAATASVSQIAIHEHGTVSYDPKLPFDRKYPHGTFTLQLAGLTSNPAGTTRIVPQPGQTTHVDGETQIPVVGTDTLTTKDGTLELAYK
jgi:hypothetical protein